MPWGDWQFWVVTMIAAFAFWVVFKRFIPKKKRKKDAGDAPHAATSSEHRVRLTVNKKRV